MLVDKLILCLGLLVFPALACENALLLQLKTELGDEIAQKMFETYPDLAKAPAGSDLEKARSLLSPEDAADLQNDLVFLEANPNLPIENIFSTLRNYKPQNASQQEALRWAQKLVSAKPGQGAGLFLQGAPGLGKTHLSVAVAKEFFRQGLRVAYIATDSRGFVMDPPKYENFDVFVLDDFNNGYGNSRDVYRSAIYRVHKHGGKIFVTSNSTMEKYTTEAVEEAERPRFMDRIKTLFKILRLDGDSYRKENGWFD
jgi:DNA replication protein DnaC